MKDLGSRVVFCKVERFRLEKVIGIKLHYRIVNPSALEVYGLLSDRTEELIELFPVRSLLTDPSKP